jgi:hypothetical protein
MIKVINHVPDESFIRSMLCVGCGVTLEFTPSDTKRITARTSSTTSKIYTCIDCPVCKTVLCLDKE